ncbi:MAG: hypothetical protein R3D68_18235 [Hyphomicrobiaceae bacterium]
MMLVGAGSVSAQQQGGTWQTTVPKSAPKAQQRNGWSEPGRTTIVPSSTAPAKSSPTPATQGEVALQALLTDEGSPISKGVVWRIYKMQTPNPAATQKPQLVITSNDASPVLKLAPGDYMVHAAFGRAYVTQKVKVAAGQKLSERVVLNAGGLRVVAVDGAGLPLRGGAVTFDVLAGEGEQVSARETIISAAKPGLILRLNAGIYHIISSFGDANSIVRSDVSVEAGKLSEAVVTHLASKVRLKLVTREGGEAMADTRWTIKTADGDVVRESAGALPTHILAAGNYRVVAQNGEQTFERTFTLVPGVAVDVELIMR